MGLWDKIKGFFGVKAQPAREPLFDEEEQPTSALRSAVEDAIEARVKAAHLFTAQDLATQVLKGQRALPQKANKLVRKRVHELYDEGFFSSLGYQRDYALGATADVYHPRGTSAEQYPGKGGGKAREAPATARQAVTAKQAKATPKNVPAPPQPAAPAPAAKTTPYRQHADPYSGGEALGMSAEELRARALQIQPWLTPFIGRTDLIPPTSDERTRLIDRALVLRGYLTEAQLEEIHRIGDEWLEHKQDARVMELRARSKTREALEEHDKKKLEAKAEKKRAAAERRAQRTKEIAERRATDIVFLGKGVSGKLGDRRSDLEALERANLPLLSTPADLARALELDIPTLRWLAFHTEAAERIHYVQFEVPKKTSGVRVLSAPLPKLARAQGWILREILEKLPLSDSAHGFARGRSTVTNATPHVGRAVVVNVDLKDFFPSIRFPRVRGLFEELGYSPAVSTILALLVTEAPRQKVELEGKRYWVARAPRGLPQGASTSPAISNYIARKLDRRLVGMCAKHGVTYTRYADDLTFSGDKETERAIGMLLARVRHIVTEEGFTVHPDKVHVARAGNRQLVTGVVVNHRLAVPREELRSLRAILHAAKKTSLEAENREAHPDFGAHLRGRIAYVSMIDPAKGAALLTALEALGPAELTTK
ncbi:MAG: reverse transcriptase family protein [Polyangiaceae bacterium]